MAGAGTDPPAFCAEGSTFRPGAAEAFGRWALAKVHYPAPAKLHEFLELRASEDLGVHVAAARDFSCRDLVISEAALLKIADATAEARARLERRFGERAAFLAPALGVDWANIGEDARLAALSLFYAHPAMSRPGCSQVDANLRAADEVLASSAELQGRFDAKDLLRFLHIVDLNIHRDDEIAEHADFTGIFVFGSKFSHSCAPNCAWSFSKEGRLQYHAIRPIASGELLTFSYVGNGMNLLTSTLERRRRLSTLWFVCRCARCLGPDLSRWLRCPGCGAARGCLPEYASAGGEDDGGAERLLDAPAQVGVPDARRWRCAACGGAFAAADLPLQDEADLCRLVPQAMMKGPKDAPGAAANEARLFQQLRSRAARTVGPEHWTYILAGFAWLQRVLAQLKHERVVVLSEAEAQAVSGEVAKWLEANAAQNSEQRLSALFASLRLEHDLGGGLAAWGYDPAEPLGGGLCSAARLEECGWRISAGGSAGCLAEDARGRSEVRRQRPARWRDGPPCLGWWR